jgi:hypothetical protein
MKKAIWKSGSHDGDWMDKGLYYWRIIFSSMLYCSTNTARAAYLWWYFWIILHCLHVNCSRFLAWDTRLPAGDYSPNLLLQSESRQTTSIVPLTFHVLVFRIFDYKKAASTALPLQWYNFGAFPCLSSPLLSMRQLLLSMPDHWIPRQTSKSYAMVNLIAKPFIIRTLCKVKRSRDPELIEARGSTPATYVMLRGMQQKREKVVCRRKMQDRDPDIYQSYCQWRM